MTTAHRRDKDTRGGSVIAGLRMEPKLAAAVTKWARTFAVINGKADISRAVRMLLRIGLGLAANNPEAAAYAEKDSNTWPVIAAGLRGESVLRDVVRKRAKDDGVGIAATIRRTLRLRLGWHSDDSDTQEERFAVIAEARRGLMENN